jgi:serine/threonine protein phosphatase PrpC
MDVPALLRKYGSTLLGLVIADDFVFAFQLGDGDIVRIDDTEIETLVEGDKILGVETHSIGKEKAWENALSKVIRINKSDNLPYAYFLTTDGFANSYPSQDEYEKAIRDYFDVMKTHGADAIKSNLAKWLSETSAMGCGDDTTMVVSYYADDKTEINGMEKK